jgi:L-ribulokinase
MKDDMERTIIENNIITTLSKAAEKIEVDEDAELAIDWMNGRRTPDANQQLKGAFLELDLATDAPRLFRALAEGTCFGARAIVESFISQGVPVNGLIGLGGVAKKSPFIMQMMADVMNKPLKIHKSEQTCAAGAAMFAATASGIYHTVEEAMEAMGSGFDTTYFPDTAKTEMYTRRYKKYKKTGAFIEQLNKE